LGGIDGLLHVGEMSWERLHDPHEVVHTGQSIEVYILNLVKEEEEIALSLRHKTPDPWARVEEKYPVVSKHRSEAVKVIGYDVFVRLGPGVEVRVQIGEMSWTKRSNPPRGRASMGERVEVQVLSIAQEKREISLGMKQVQPNPWDSVAQRYPPETIVT